MPHGKTLTSRAAHVLRIMCVLALVALPSADPASAATRPLTVVAVGDSYASGEGAIGDGWDDADCHRSLLAGPRNGALRLNAHRSTSFTSFACSGATTSSLTGPGGQLSMLPSGRIDALTVSIGNDIGVGAVVVGEPQVDGALPVDAVVREWVPATSPPTWTS
jgi:hypothetical protein